MANFKKKTGVLAEANDENLDAKKVEETITESVKDDKNETEASSDLAEAEKSNDEELNSVFNPTSVESDTAEFVPEQKEEAKVKVRLNADYRGCIGGVRYYLEKDHTYTVDENLKRILNKSGLLKPLS